MSGLKATTTERTNQGIVDGRPEGQQPPRAPITRDTVVDKDASSDPPISTSASETLGGVTSGDVYESAGKPGSGMSSAEMRHDGHPGRKRQEEGLTQWGTGPGGAMSKEMDRASREV